MIELKNVSKQYQVGEHTVHALKNINLTIQDAEFLAIVGPSGSGKSTLLHVIGGLDQADEGDIFINGENLKAYDDTALSHYRNNTVGFVFQEFHLQNFLNLEENIGMPLWFSHKQSKATSPSKSSIIQQLATEVGIHERLNHKPTQISGGQKQRTAIARALVNHPQLLLADEPTGNLDPVTSEKIIQLFRKIHQERKVTVIIVTHDRQIAKHADRIIEIKDGKLVTKNHAEQFVN